MTRQDLRGEIPLPLCDKSSHPVLRASGGSTIALPACPNGESGAWTHRTHAIHFNLKVQWHTADGFDSPETPCNLRNTSRWTFQSAGMDIEKWRIPGALQKKSTAPSYRHSRTARPALLCVYVELPVSGGIASVKVAPCPEIFYRDDPPTSATPASQAGKSIAAQCQTK